MTVTLENPPVANIRTGPQVFGEDEFVRVANVPVFVAHETTTRKGRRLNFGPRELAAIAANCNRRIERTGDYTAVVIGHTADPATAGPAAPPQELIGFAGPYRLGRLPGDGTPAILCDYHIFREDFARLKKFPRRSPELWVKDSYEEMFFDPICCLGAEAPRLDMGLVYSARRSPEGDEIEVYTAAAPSAFSSFIPETVTAKTQAAGVRADQSPRSAAQPLRGLASSRQITRTDPSNEVRNRMALSDDDVRQIVEAISQTDWAKWAQAQMQAEGAEEQADDTAAAAAPPVDTPPGPPPGEPKPEDDSAVKYSQVFARLDSIEAENEKLKKALETEQARRVDTERYARLAALGREFVLDPKEELEVCRYGRASDAEFARHEERIKKHYKRLPVETMLPTFDAAILDAPDRVGSGAERQQYSKALAERAAAETIRRRDNGEKVSYEAVLDQLAREGAK